MNAIKQKAGADPAQMAQTIGKSKLHLKDRLSPHSLKSFQPLRTALSQHDRHRSKCRLAWLICRKKLNTYAENADKLRYAAQFNSVDKELSDNGLSGVSESYRTGNVDSENVEKHSPAR